MITRATRWRRPPGWRELYGANPLHLLAVLGGLALAGYAALGTLTNPAWPAMLLWFAVAIVAHDLVVFPLYALGDRLLGAAQPGPAVNYLRVPLLGVGLTLLVFFPGIVEQGSATFRAATGLDQAPYLSRWLLLSAAMFAASALVFVVRSVAERLRR
jgi:hypothetical protein